MNLTKVGSLNTNHWYPEWHPFEVIDAEIRTGSDRIERR